MEVNGERPQDGQRIRFCPVVDGPRPGDLTVGDFLVEGRYDADRDEVKDLDGVRWAADRVKWPVDGKGMDILRMCVIRELGGWVVEHARLIGRLRVTPETVSEVYRKYKGAAGASPALIRAVMLRLVHESLAVRLEGARPAWEITPRT